MDGKLQLFFQHRFTPEVRRRLDTFLAAENARIAPAQLGIRAVINEAVQEWLDRQQRREERAA